LTAVWADGCGCLPHQIYHDSFHAQRVLSNTSVIRISASECVFILTTGTLNAYWHVPTWLIKLWSLEADHQKRDCTSSRTWIKHRLSELIWRVCWAGCSLKYTWTVTALRNQDFSYSWYPWSHSSYWEAHGRLCFYLATFQENVGGTPDQSHAVLYQWGVATRTTRFYYSHNSKLLLTCTTNTIPVHRNDPLSNCYWPFLNISGQILTTCLLWHLSRSESYSTVSSRSTTLQQDNCEPSRFPPTAYTLYAIERDDSRAHVCVGPELEDASCSISSEECIPLSVLAHVIMLTAHTGCVDIAPNWSPTWEAARREQS
jgi:hypothetical protein